MPDSHFCLCNNGLGWFVLQPVPEQRPTPEVGYGVPALVASGTVSAKTHGWGTRHVVAAGLSQLTSRDPCRLPTCQWLGLITPSKAHRTTYILHGDNWVTENTAQKWLQN